MSGPFRHRTRGQTHGPITRLMSPGDLGQRLKPFVFLDAVRIDGAGAGGFGWHPHSGIATATVQFAGDVWTEESTGERHTVQAGGLEWVEAGGGVWHQGGAEGNEAVEGFQLWLALPEERELRPASAEYLAPATLPGRGSVGVVLGEYDGLRSPVPSTRGVTYLRLELGVGERLSLSRRPGEVGFLAILSGEVRVTDAAGNTESLSGVALGELDVTATELSLVADSPARLVYGSAPPHPHPLVLGRTSVHTSADALREGERGIMRIQAELRDRLDGAGSAVAARYYARISSDPGVVGAMQEQGIKP